MIRLRFGVAPVALAMGVVTSTVGAAWSQVVRPDFYVTNGTVRATALRGNTLYIGGNSTFVGPATGGGVPIDTTTGIAASGFPVVEGKVFAVAPDGSGGWYIGGRFTSVGGVPRSNIAHVNANLSVSPWNPNSDGDVLALAVNSPAVYAGGWFANIGGQARPRLAALDATTGLATPWDPHASGGGVAAIVVSGLNVYAGGFFDSTTTIGGQPRNFIAALDATTGMALAFNPNADGPVRALAGGGPTLYVGGDFRHIGGQSRSHLAAVNPAGSVLSWNPNPKPDPNIFALGFVGPSPLGGPTVFVAGDFDSIGGQPRSRVAAVDPLTGLATSWNPGADGHVLALAVIGSTVYLGGNGISQVGGQPRNNIAAVDRATGATLPWNPNANGQVEALAVSGSSVYAGGEFTSIGRQPHDYIAALDVTTGAVTPWDPTPNGPVSALTTLGGVVYAGGEFTHIGGQTRSHLAALDTATAAATAWSPNVNGSVLTLAATGATLYAGGTFTTVGVLTRNHIAAISTTTGTASSWNPNADSVVYSVVPAGNRVYAGGAFLTIGGQSRNRIAALDAGSGTATSWNPNASGRVFGIAISGATVYAGGDFTILGGQSRGRIASIDTAGVVGLWNPNANGGVRALAPSGNVVYVSGGFTTIGGQPRGRIAAVLSADSGSATPWNPSAVDTVLTLATDGSAVFAGGTFASIGGQPQTFLAAIDPFCEVPGTIGSTSFTMPGPQSSTTGDFDGDGALDLAVADANGAEVLRNIGGGQFQSNAVIPIGSAGTGVATAELNHDGVLDLAISTSAGFYVALGNRNAPGSFASAIPQPVGGTSPAGIAIADLDHDGINDIVVALAGSAHIAVLHGQGSGGNATGAFDPPVSYVTEMAPLVPVLGDFDGDGWWDVAVTNSGSNNVSILLGGVGGVFAPSSTVSLGAGPRSIALGDFDRDGIVDLVVGTSNPNTVKILRGNGNGSFTVSATYPTSPATFSGPVRDLEAADFDANGRADLAAVLDNGWIQYLYGDGVGSIGNGAFLIGPQVQITGALSSLQVNAFATPDAPTAVVGQSDMNRLVTVTGWCTGGTARSLEVAYPNGGETVNLGDRVPIQWAHNDLTVAVDVDISRDGGVHWERIASNQTGHELDWTVAPPGTTHGRFRVVDSNLFTAHDESNGDLTIAPLTGVGSPTPSRLALSLAHPNPTRGTARFELALPAPADVDVEVFDLQGRRVQTLAHGRMPAGTHTLAWDGRQDGGARAGAGLYFVRARMPGFEAVRRVVRVE